MPRMKDVTRKDAIARIQHINKLAVARNVEFTLRDSHEKTLSRNEMIQRLTELFCDVAEASDCSAFNDFTHWSNNELGGLLNRPFFRWTSAHVYTIDGAWPLADDEDEDDEESDDDEDVNIVLGEDGHLYIEDEEDCEEEDCEEEDDCEEEEECELPQPKAVDPEKHPGFKIGDVIRMRDYTAINAYRVWRVVSVVIGGDSSERAYELIPIDRDTNDMGICVPFVMLITHPDIELL